MDEWKEKIEEQWKLILIILVACSTLLFIGVTIFDRPVEKPPIDPYEMLIAEVKGEEVDAATEISEILEESLSEVIMVDIKGAVRVPGVYEMNAKDRVIDVIDRAEGIIDNADSKGVNFAQKVEDQMVIYIPEIGEEYESPVQTIESSSEGTTLVNINEADKNRLMTLNGIGASKADSIIRYRDEHGFFKTIDDIKNVSGIGNATFENLKEMITITN